MFLFRFSHLLLFLLGAVGFPLQAISEIPPQKPLPPQFIQTVRLAPVAGMIRAELKHDTLPKDCAGVLVLCPGFNRDGEYLIREKGWRELAAKQRLLLVGLHFVSHEEDLKSVERRGYYYAEKGSGKLLLDGLKKITNGRELPITIFGFSGGAHFTHRFVYLYPDKVRVWAVYGFGWHDETPAITAGKTNPPGLFICGLEDERLGSVRDAFLSALRARWKVCWLGVPRNVHVIQPSAAAWAREFFDAVLSAPPAQPGIWEEGEFGRGLEGFLIRAWFPSASLQKSWREFR